MSLPDRSWTATTHDWRRDIDVDHLDQIRRGVGSYAAGGITHLVLEIVAYAADEAQALGRRGSCLVQLRSDGSVSVMDNGRGTDTRMDSAGRPVRKPIMATRDLRFFDSANPPTLGDGLPRRGISVVAALSTWLVHVNRRTEGAWSQEYRDGLPSEGLMPLPADGTTGTTVSFLACDAVRETASVTSDGLEAGLIPVGPLLEVSVADLR